MIDGPRLDVRRVSRRVIFLVFVNTGLGSDSSYCDLNGATSTRRLSHSPRDIAWAQSCQLISGIIAGELADLGP